MSDGDIQDILENAIQKERRLVTLEMQVKNLEDSLKTGLKEIKDMIKLGMSLVTIIFSAVEIVLRFLGH